MPTILQKISKAVEDYYDSEETMSDKEFDNLVLKLKKKGISIDDVLAPKSNPLCGICCCCCC